MITADRVHLKPKLKHFSDEWVTSVSLFTATKALGGVHNTLQSILLRKGLSQNELSGVLINTKDLTPEVAYRVVVANTNYIANVGTAVEPEFVRLSAEAANSRSVTAHIDAEDVLARSAVSRQRRSRNGR